MGESTERLLSKVSELASKNQLQKIKDLNQDLEVSIWGKKCTDNYCTINKSTLLGIAAFEGNLFVVNSLLEAGADPDSLSWGYRQLYTPAHLVVFGTSEEYGTLTSKASPVNNRIEIIQSLHKYGADFDWCGNDIGSWSPLYTSGHQVTSSYWHGGREITNEFLRLGARPTSSIYENLNSYIPLACEEAAKKYESSMGYQLPESLHKITLEKLESFKFQYSLEDSELQVIGIENYKGDIENVTCHNKVDAGSTEIFDLSEVGYIGEFTAQDLLDF